MNKIKTFIRREPVALLGVLAIFSQGLVEEATANGITTWGQVVTLVLVILARQFVTPVKAPNWDAITPEYTADQDPHA